MALPHDVLARLASLTGYDQMLEMDSISRSHNVGLAEIESQLAAFKSGTINTQTNEVADFSPVSSKEVVNLENAQPIDTAPKISIIPIISFEIRPIKAGQSINHK